MAEPAGYWIFLTNINWKEPWLVLLLAIHLLMTTCIFSITKGHTNVQICLFIALLSSAYCSESINEYAAKNWRLFSSKQYFDSDGLFISTVFSIPILLNCVLIIVSWLRTSSSLLILKLKLIRKRQLLTEKRREKPTSGKLT